MKAHAKDPTKLGFLQFDNVQNYTWQSISHQLFFNKHEIMTIYSPEDTTMVELLQKTITELHNSSLLSWNSFEDPLLLRFVIVLAESNLSRRNHQSSELKGPSKTNLGAANDIDSPGSSGVVDRIPNTEKGGTYASEQENV
jgi:hypothetical protein